MEPATVSASVYGVCGCITTGPACIVIGGAAITTIAVVGIAAWAYNRQKQWNWRTVEEWDQEMIRSHLVP